MASLLERLQRKVNPIYDCLDSGNYKGALKLCDKKDIKDYDIVVVLKAHALERLGRSEEALTLCRQIKEKKPTDQGILTALTLTFKLMDLQNEATECFENALAANPNNPEMIQEVHFSFTRSFNYQKQQQYAMKLYKQISAPHFVFWSATAMLLQVRTSGEQSKMLVLSEKMVQRAIDARIEKGQRPSSQEINLLVALLKQQGKTAEALSLVISHKDDSNTLSPIHDEDTLKNKGVASEFLLMQPIERLQLEALLRFETNDFSGAVTAYEQLIEKDAEEWSHHMGYFDALFSSESMVTLLVEQPNRFAAMKASSPKSRTPYLVEMDFLKRVGVLQGGGVSVFPDPLGDMGDCILKYLDLFSHKLCCFTDLETYLSDILSVESSVADKVTSEIKQIMESNYPAKTLEISERTEKLHRYICCRQCLRYLEKSKRSVENLLADAKSLFDLFVDTLDVNAGATGGQREVQHGDELVLLAVHMLRDAAALDPSIYYQCHLDSALILQFGRSCSPYNFHMNLCMIEECRQLSCFELGIGLYNDLKVRHVQMDSLSYLLSPGCLEGGYFTEVERQCRDILRFHKVAARDAGDYAVKAYECGNYMQVMELCEFQCNSLSRSVQLALARADSVLLQLVSSKHSKEDVMLYLEELQGAKSINDYPKHDLDFDSLVFNHDFNVGLDWAGEKTEKATSMKQTFLRQLKLHTCLPFLLQECLSAKASTGSSDIEKVEEVLESFLGNCNDSSCNAVVGGNMTENVSRCDSLCWRLCHLVFKAVFKLKLNDVNTTEALLQESKSLLAELSSLFQCVPYVTDQSSPSSSSPVLAPWWFASCSTFCISALPIVSLMLQHLTSSSSSGKSKKNKKGASNSSSDVVSSSSVIGQETVALQKDLVDLINHLISVLKQEDASPAAFSAIHTSSLFSELLLTSNTEAAEEAVVAATGGDESTSAPPSFAASTDKVFSALTSSHKLSVTRLVDLLNAKLKVLSA